MLDARTAAEMRADWNARAREDAGYYVAYGRRGQDDAGFYATASEVVRRLEAELERLKDHQQRDQPKKKKKGK